MSLLDQERCWTSVEERTCGVCLDRTDDGECRVPARGSDCPLRTFFPGVIDLVRSVHSDRMDPYVARVEADICGQCPELGPAGQCARRHRGECALYAYLPITVDAIEETLDAER